MISIIVLSYNYQNFVCAAVDSALAQTLPCQVIVVDDGSTDGSLALLQQRYADRVTIVSKPNGGEASAVAAGFAVAQGDWIIVLDSDDLLAPHCAATVARHFAPGVAKVQYRLATIDAEGRDQGRPFPNYPTPMSPADARQWLLSQGDYPTPPNTGNALSRAMLEQLMPVQDRRFRNSFDGYVTKLAPLYGEVVTLPEVLGAYRVHGNNFWARQDKRRMWTTYLQHDLDRQEVLLAHAARLGVALPAQPLLRNLRHLENRILSLRIAPAHHPLPQDRLGPLCRASLVAAALSPRLSLPGRLLWAGFLLAACYSPLSLLHFLLQDTRGAAGRRRWLQWLVRLSHTPVSAALGIAAASLLIVLNLAGFILYSD